MGQTTTTQQGNGLREMEWKEQKQTTYVWDGQIYTFETQN